MDSTNNWLRSREGVPSGEAERVAMARARSFQMEALGLPYRNVNLALNSINRAGFTLQPHVASAGRQFNLKRSCSMAGEGWLGGLRTLACAGLLLLPTAGYTQTEIKKTVPEARPPAQS